MNTQQVRERDELLQMKEDEDDSSFEVSLENGNISALLACYRRHERTRGGAGSEAGLQHTHLKHFLFGCFCVLVSQVCLSVYMNVLHTYHGQVFKDLDPVSWSHVGHVVEVGWVGD